MGNQTIVPVAGDIVTARVTVINQRFAKCAIICIGDVVLKRVYRGLLRKEDVRAERKDDVDMYKSFRPGDIILARIVSNPVTLSPMALAFLTYSIPVSD